MPRIALWILNPIVRGMGWNASQLGMMGWQGECDQSREQL